MAVPNTAPENMKAVVFHKPEDMRVESVDDPRIEDPRDVILRVTSTAICGSDLHMYNGFFPQPKPLVMGHEFMGVVEEVGTRVTKLRRGEGRRSFSDSVRRLLLLRTGTSGPLREVESKALWSGRRLVRSEGWRAVRIH